MHEIITTIDKNGSVTVEVKGVKGPSCKALTKEYEEALGAKVSEKLTGEYHEQQVVPVQRKA